MASTSRHFHRNKLVQLTLLHAFFLTIFLLFLSYQRALLLPVESDITRTAFNIALQDIAVISFLQVFWLLFAFFAFDKWVKQPSVTFLTVTHSFLYIVAIIDQQFFAKTGSSLDFNLLYYAALHFGELYKVLLSGFDVILFINIIMALLFLSLFFISDKKEQFKYNFYDKPLLRYLFPILILCLGIGTAGIGVTNTPPGFYKGVFILKDRNDLYATIATHDIQHKKIYEPPILKSTSQEKPNIVLIIMESARARSFSFSTYAGNNTAHTPFLNQLAAKSLIIDNTYATVTHTSKALVGILCGMYPKLIMPITESAPNELPLKCLPQYLNEIGYKTAFFQTAPGSFENRPGLIKNIGYNFLETQETIDQKDFGKAGYFGLDEFAMIEPSLSWIKENKTSPFFLTYLTVLSHHPYELPNKNLPNTNDISKYNATLEHTDRFIENIYDDLKSNGLLDNTVLIIIGDHGEGFGEHGLRLHDVVPYEEATRVPFIIHNPKWPDNMRKTRGLRHQVDLLPTIFDILKLDWTGYLPGKSVLTPKGHDSIVTSCWYDNFCLSMRKGDYKYIYHFRNIPVEMFDIIKDPGEKNNLAPREPVNNVASAIKELLSFKFSVDHYYSNNSNNSNNSNKTNNQDSIEQAPEEENNLLPQESVNSWASAIKELLSFKFSVDHSYSSNDNKTNNQELIERPHEETDI